MQIICRILKLKGTIDTIIEYMLTDLKDYIIYSWYINSVTNTYKR